MLSIVGPEHVSSGMKHPLPVSSEADEELYCASHSFASSNCSAEYNDYFKYFVPLSASARDNGCESRLDKETASHSQPGVNLNPINISTGSISAGVSVSEEGDDDANLCVPGTTSSSLSLEINNYNCLACYFVINYFICKTITAGLHNDMKQFICPSAHGEKPRRSVETQVGPIGKLHLHFKRSWLFWIFISFSVRFASAEKVDGLENVVTVIGSGANFSVGCTCSPGVSPMWYTERQCDRKLDETDPNWFSECREYDGRKFCILGYNHVSRNNSGNQCIDVRDRVTVKFIACLQIISKPLIWHVPSDTGGALINSTFTTFGPMHLTSINLTASSKSSSCNFTANNDSRDFQCRVDSPLPEVVNISICFAAPKNPEKGAKPADNEACHFEEYYLSRPAYEDEPAGGSATRPWLVAITFLGSAISVSIIGLVVCIVFVRRIKIRQRKYETNENEVTREREPGLLSVKPPDTP